MLDQIHFPKRTLSNNFLNMEIVKCCLLIFSLWIKGWWFFSSLQYLLVLIHIHSWDVVSGIWVLPFIHLCRKIFEITEILLSKFHIRSFIGFFYPCHFQWNSWDPFFQILLTSCELSKILRFLQIGLGKDISLQLQREEVVKSDCWNTVFGWHQ